MRLNSESAICWGWRPLPENSSWPEGEHYVASSSGCEDGRLRRIHADQTLEAGLSRLTLEYWRTRPTDEIVQSLQPGHPEGRKVKADGRIMNGNIRIKVLEERGFDMNSLPREVLP